MAQYEPITQEHEPSKRQERMSYDPERIRAAEAYAMEELEEDNIHRPGTNRPPDYGDDEHPLDSEPLLFNGFSSARDHPSGYEDGRNSVDGFGHLLPEGEGAKSTLMAGIANMSNSILGAGIIGLPFAIAEAGFFTGVALLIILCGVTDWTIRLIILNAKLSGRDSYIGIMEACFGYPGRVAVSFFQFAFALGG
ncbi:hypothetical protein NCC49_000264 [Naganishia albida]|nr:hypothetical protein NCC49_000264 [Naganishia albida]